VILTSKEGAAMGFVQIIQFKTSKLDEMQKVGSEWEAAAGADSTARRRVLCQDRDHPGQFVNIVFFDSHEEAMQNSELAATQEFSQKMMSLADGPPTFLNLDVLEDVSS
jgi:prepilin-type processing-associated H-X9-DG protein